MRCEYCDQDHNEDSLYHDSLAGGRSRGRILWRALVQRFLCDTCWAESSDPDRKVFDPYQELIDSDFDNDDYDNTVNLPQSGSQEDEDYA